MHQKYIYTWMDSHVIPYWMMAVDIRYPEVQERTPYNQGKKESGWDLAPGKEPWKRKLFLRPGKPLHWPRGQSGQKVSFRDLEESILTGALVMVGAGRRQRWAEDWCYLAALRGRRCTPACTRRGWVLKLGVQDGPRDSTGWLHRDSLKGLKCDCRKSPGPPQQQSAIAKGHVKGWAWPAIIASFIKLPLRDLGAGQ